MKKFSLTYRDPRIMVLMETMDHTTLGIWAKDCAERIMYFFEKEYPSDHRPRTALDILQDWIDTGVFSMKVIRKASLDSHAAAREVGEDTPARSAARAAGQAVATAHVRTHAYGGAIYAQQAIFRGSKPDEVEVNIEKEREWQYNHLRELIKKS